MKRTSQELISLWDIKIKIFQKDYEASIIITSKERFEYLFK